MEIKDFIKKPIVIITGLILISYIFLPYFSFSESFFGIKVSDSATGIELLFSIFKSFSFFGFLTILIPAAIGYMIFCLWNNDLKLLTVLKGIILGMHVILVIKISFLGDFSSIKFVGFGLWLSLILSVALFFEKQIEDAVCKNNSQIPPQE